MAEQTLKGYLVDPLWKENQILVAILGICSALGVTVNLTQATTMGIAVALVTGCSSMCVSMLRNYTPDSVRMIAQLAVISTFVTIVDQFLAAYNYEMSKTMSVFVGLIITNCIVMGRAEAVAKNVPPVPAFLDGFGAGAGYAVVLFIVAFFRELFGFGTLFGSRVIPDAWYYSSMDPDGYQNIGIMVYPPAAFFILGAMIWGANLYKMRKK